MEITAVHPQQHDPERVAIFVDGTFAVGCHAQVWLESGLHIGDALTPAGLAALQESEAVRAIKDRALRLLANRPRGRVELQRQLGRGTAAHPAPNPAHVEAALEQLTAQGLLDDRAFAEFWVEQRDRFRPKGSQALRAELRGRGVGRAEIDEAVTPERDLERAVTAAHRKAQQVMSRPGINARQFREQIGPFLQRRGFSYGVARAAMLRLWNELGGREDLRDVESEPDE